MASLTVATYNVHRTVGRDGVLDPERVAAVIDELAADVVALQEVESGSLARIEAATGMRALAGPTLEREGSSYGNALLTRLPVQSTVQVDLSVSGREPRGALDTLIDVGSDPVRVVATHLGLTRNERVRQLGQLLARLESRAGALTVLLGDMNEWRPFSRTLRRLERRLGRAPAPRSFPSGRPVLALDRIWVSPRERLQELAAHRSPLARVASDHLPVRARIAW